MTDRVGNEENPQQAEYLKHLYQGSELLLNDKITEAREALEQASRIDPDDPKCLSLLGLVYFRLDELEPAQQIYELLVQRFPEEASLRVNLGLVYMKQGHADKALDQMNRGVAIDKDHQRAYGYLGLLYSERGEHERAREAFERAGQDAMVQKMDELIAAGREGEASVAASLSAEALPPDPEPFGGAADAPAEEAAPMEAAADASPGGGIEAPPDAPAPGSPPPLTPATPADAMQPLSSDGQTLPVQSRPKAVAPPLEDGPAEPTEVPEVVPSTAAEGGGEDVLDDEIDAVIDEAVSPREPWPSDSGVLPEPSGVEPYEEEPAPETEPPEEGTVPSAPPAASESVAIFSYATAELIDLAARAVRMYAPRPGSLIFPVDEDGFVRAESLTSYVGDVQFEDAHRRAKGQFTDEPMQDSRGRFLKVIGEGVLLCDAGSEPVTVLDLFDDFLYLRTEYLLAFESTLHWENGKVRGTTGPIELIHIRGEGRLALVGADSLRKVRLVPEREAFVAEHALVGWMGRVTPQTLPLGAEVVPDPVLHPMMRCEGEGVILVRAAEPGAPARAED